jgi:hypothetical protein
LTILHGRRAVDTDSAAAQNRRMALSIKTSDDILANLDRLRAEYAALPVHDGRSPDEILGYDETGLPW